MPVFNFLVNYVLRRLRKVDRVRMDLGAGFTKTVIKTSAQSRADGTGGVSSYRGQNIFTLTLDRRAYGGDFDAILDFLQARVDNGDESFYFYHPDERSTPDPTGADTTGRYAVRFLGNIQDVLARRSSHDFVDVVFEETFI